MTLNLFVNIISGDNFEGLFTATMSYAVSEYITGTVGDHHHLYEFTGILN